MSKSKKASRTMTITISPEDGTLYPVSGSKSKQYRLMERIAEKIRPLYRGDGFWGCRSIKAAIIVCKILERRGIKYEADVVRVVEGPYADCVWGVGNKHGFGPSRAGYERVTSILREAGITCESSRVTDG